jgi:septum formation protein
MRDIFLASTSPRRKELLRQIIGDNFKVIPSNYHEKTKTGNIEPADLIILNSQGKAKEVASTIYSGIVIAADTAVLCNDIILGKPYTENEAQQMLRQISGKRIKVITGLTVIDIDANIQTTTSETTDVIIKHLSDSEIESYVNTKEPLEKAGAFAIQGKGAVIVERIEGDYFNVVGLPLFSLNKILGEMGVNVLEII